MPHRPGSVRHDLELEGPRNAYIGVGNLPALPDPPQSATQPETDPELKKESWDAHEGCIQEVIGERHNESGLECQVVIYTTRWVPRAAVGTKLLRRFRKRQRVEKAGPTQRSLRLK